MGDDEEEEEEEVVLRSMSLEEEEFHTKYFSVKAPDKINFVKTSNNLTF
jgi:hypothetical protein